MCSDANGKGPGKGLPQEYEAALRGQCRPHQGFEFVVAQGDIGGIGYDLSTGAKIQGL